MRVKTGLLKVAGAVFFLVMLGCATTRPPSKPENLVIKPEPEYVMRGNFGKVEVVHQAVIVFRGKKPRPLDWASQNVLKGVDEVKELRMEFELHIGDPKISRIFIQRVLNGNSSEWLSIEPLEKVIVFWVKLPTEGSEQMETFVQLRFIRNSADSDLVKTKTLMYKLEK